MRAPRLTGGQQTEEAVAANGSPLFLQPTAIPGRKLPCYLEAVLAAVCTVVSLPAAQCEGGGRQEKKTQLQFKCT